MAIMAILGQQRPARPEQELGPSQQRNLGSLEMDSLRAEPRGSAEAKAVRRPGPQRVRDGTALGRRRQAQGSAGQVLSPASVSRSSDQVFISVTHCLFQEMWPLLGELSCTHNWIADGPEALPAL